MNNSLRFAALLGLIALALAAKSRGDYRNPNYPGMCVINSTIIVPTGTHRHPDRCARIVCSNGFATILSCGVIIAGPGCKLGDYIEPDADYPACCMRHIICV